MGKVGLCDFPFDFWARDNPDSLSRLPGFAVARDLSLAYWIELFKRRPKLMGIASDLNSSLDLASPFTGCFFFVFSSKSISSNGSSGSGSDKFSFF